MFSTFTGYQVEDEVPDFQDLSSDIEQQFLELSSLDDAVFIDGWEEHLKKEDWRRLRGERHIFPKTCFHYILYSIFIRFHSIR